MAIFKCQQCTKWKFEKKATHCSNCRSLNDKEKQQQKEQAYQKHLEKKKQRKAALQKQIDSKLLEEVKKVKHKPAKVRKQPTIKETKPTKITSKPIIIEEKINLEELSLDYDPLLYIKATVKRLYAEEYRSGKKRVLLNKEREIRRTHKGGFSQEKFQKFVDSQKKKAPEWIEKNLTKQGVLRPPYAKIIVESNDKNLQRIIYSLLNVTN